MIPMQMMQQIADQCLEWYCPICAEEATARAEIEAEAEMERRAERAFEERRW